MKRLIIPAFILLACNSFAQTADRVFKNAKIYTALDGAGFEQAIAVKADSIVYVGSDSGADAYIGPSTFVYDMGGKLMMPGIHDVHIHTLEATSTTWGNCPLDPLEYDAWNLGQTLYNCGLTTNFNGWLTAFGHSIYTMLDATDPPVDILDAYFPNTPIVVMEETSHSVWVNSAGLAAAGISASTPDPVGGHIMIDPITNQPNGILVDNAGDIVLQIALAANASTEANDYDGLVNYGLPQLAQHGITSMCDGRTYWKRNYHTTWQNVHDDDELTARTVLGIWAYPDDEDATLIPALTNLYDEGDEMLRAHQIKLYSDGITINATAALHEPYNDNLGFPFTNGLNYFDVNRLTNYITQLELIGYDFHIHAIGDRGITEALDAIEAARNTNGDIGARHRITHLEIVDSLDFARFAELNVIADMQVVGSFTQPDHWHDNDFLIGPHRSDNLIPVRSLFNAGATITLSSDWDVSDLNPFVGIQNAMTRAPQNLPTVEDAVQAYTINGAYVMRQEEETGTLEVGKYADLICVSQDIFTIPHDQIGQTQVEMTMLGGEVIYGSCGVSIGIEESGESKFKVWPTVASDHINVHSSGQPSNYHLTLTTLAGKEVSRQNFSTTFDVSLVGEGAYLLNVVDSKGEALHTSKIVVSR